MWDADARIELDFDEERCQAYVTVHPRRGDGAPVTSQDIIHLLREGGVIYGYLTGAIIQAAHYSDEEDMPPLRLAVAQGILPVDGVDGRIRYEIDVQNAQRPLPRRPDGLIDYFALEPERRVSKGQHLASVLPPARGAAGASLLSPLTPVLPDGGRRVTLNAGKGVRVSADRLRYFAADDGFVELSGGTLTVHTVRVLDGDLGPDSFSFPGGVVILGDVKGARIHACGPTAIRGTVAGATIRAMGEVLLGRAARTTVVTECDVHVDSTLQRCTVITRARLIAGDDASIVGGRIVAGQGLQVGQIGSPEGEESRALAGFDRVSGLRLNEIEEEITAAKTNVHRIAEALRPLKSGPSESSSARKREILRALVDQRQELETRLRQLLSEKRLALMRTNERLDCAVVVRGTVYPGVQVTLHNVSMTVAERLDAVAFVEDSDGSAVRAVGLKDRRLLARSAERTAAA